MVDHSKYQYDNYTFSSDFAPQFANTHVVSHNDHEFFLTFGCLHPPRNEVKPLAQIIINRDHAMELMFNLQNQLRKFDEKKGK